MKSLKILTYPNPLLNKYSEPVSKIGAPERTLIAGMIEAMYRDGGVGLAAPQVGVLKRILIASPNAEPGEEIVLINPVIVKSTGEQIGPEGCLSLPGVTGQVRRARHIDYEIMNLEGKTIQLSASNFLARIIQHEMDHLDGKLLIDRVDFNQRHEILSEYQRL